MEREAEHRRVGLRGRACISPDFKGCIIIEGCVSYTRNALGNNYLSHIRAVCERAVLDKSYPLVDSDFAKLGMSIKRVGRDLSRGGVNLDFARKRSIRVQNAVVGEYKLRQAAAVKGNRAYINALGNSVFRDIGSKREHNKLRFIVIVNSRAVA